MIQVPVPVPPPLKRPQPAEPREEPIQGQNRKQLLMGRRQGGPGDHTGEGAGLIPSAPPPQVPVRDGKQLSLVCLVPHGPNPPPPPLEQRIQTQTANSS